MYGTRILGQFRAMILFVYVALIIGTSVFFAVLLEQTLRHASKSNSAFDISKIQLPQAQESPRNSATRLNAIWMHERSQA